MADQGITLRQAADLYCETFDESSAEMGAPEIGAANRKYIESFMSFIDRLAAEPSVSTIRRTGETS